MNSRSRFCGSLESSSAGDSKKAAAARRRMELPQYQVTAERSKMGRDRGGRCIDRDDPINDSAKTYFTLMNIPDAAAAPSMQTRIRSQEGFVAGLACPFSWAQPSLETGTGFPSSHSTSFQKRGCGAPSLPCYGVLLFMKLYI